jgi:hypothetical protein
MNVYKRSGPAGIAAIVLVLLLPGRSLSWGSTWLGANLERIVNDARWRMGTLKYNASLQLSNAGYDSDVYFGSALKPVPDYTFTAGPQVRLFVPLAKGVILDLSEMPQYAFYLRTAGDRAFNNSLRGQLHLALDRLYFQAGGKLVSAKERVSTELNIHIRRREDDLTGMSFWQVSEKTALALQYRSFRYEYEPSADGSINIGLNLNRTERYFNLTGYLQQVARSRLYMDAEYGSFSFKEPLSRNKDSRSYGLFIGLEFLPAPEKQEQGKGIEGKINFGYKSFDFLDPRRPDYRGLVGNSSLVLRLVERTALRAGFTRDIQFSAFSDIAIYIQTSVGAGLSYAFTRMISFLYDFSYNRNKYVQIQNVGSLQQDEYFNHSLGFSVRLQKNLEGSLVASFGRRNRNTDPAALPRNFIGFTLNYGHSSGDVSILENPFSRYR